MSSETQLPPPVPAATVIVVRPGGAGLEVLMLKRSDVGAFPNFWVFPGGRIDSDDAGENDDERAASASVREAKEEVGLTVNRRALRYFSHWTPPAIQPRRFVTWFFVAPWEGDDVVIDGKEIVEFQWMSPQEAIDQQLLMAPPTILSLRDLAKVRSIEEVNRAEPPRYATVPAKTASGRAVLLWHGDSGYETRNPDLPGSRHRLYYNVADVNEPYEIDIDIDID